MTVRCRFLLSFDAIHVKIACFLYAPSLQRYLNFWLGLNGRKQRLERKRKLFIPLLLIADTYKASGYQTLMHVIPFLLPNHLDPFLFPPFLDLDLLPLIPPASIRHHHQLQPSHSLRPDQLHQSQERWMSETLDNRHLQVLGTRSLLTKIGVTFEDRIESMRVQRDLIRFLTYRSTDVGRSD